MTAHPDDQLLAIACWDATVKVYHFNGKRLSVSSKHCIKSHDNFLSQPMEEVPLWLTIIDMGHRHKGLMRHTSLNYEMVF